MVVAYMHIAFIGLVVTLCLLAEAFCLAKFENKALILLRPLEHPAEVLCLSEANYL
jgi:hypothetical protein